MLIRLDNCHFPIPDITVLKQYLTEIENDCQPADIIADIVQNDNYLQNKDLYLLPLGGLFECDFGIGVISCNNVVYDFWDKLNERLEKEGFKVSLRSKSRHVSVGRIARRLNGGGHEMAAGCTIDAPSIGEAEQILANNVEMELNEK